MVRSTVWTINRAGNRSPNMKKKKKKIEKNVNDIFLPEIRTFVGKNSHTL